jgi:hypothetical protein
MLHGVRRDLQQELREGGYNVRVYVPFGESWYPYLMRRLAERPANMLFFAGSVIQESPLGFLWPKKDRGSKKADGDGEAVSPETQAESEAGSPDAEDLQPES